MGAHSIGELVAALKRPRRVMLMVKAGKPVDELIDELTPMLEKGDILIDGGNSLFQDTSRRTKALEEKGLFFIGTGVSGGEGRGAARPLDHARRLEGRLAARQGYFPGHRRQGGRRHPVLRLGGRDENGAGHYVKMVHNGIEYGDMQLICEAYQFMKDGLGLTAEEMQKVFADWNQTELDSFLIEITSHILAYKDTDGAPLVEKILDTAGQKGTGKWTVISSAELGIPSTLITEAVLCAVRLGAQGRTGRRRQKIEGAAPGALGRSRGMGRGGAPGALRVQNHLLRAGLHADAGGGQGERLESQLRRGWR